MKNLKTDVADQFGIREKKLLKLIIIKQLW